MIKNMKNCIKIFLVVITSIINIYGVYSCSCAEPTSRFVDELEKYEFVGIVEVIRRDTVAEHERGYTYTVVKVISQFTREFYGQEFRIVDAKGFECITRLKNNKIGSKSIIKGHFNNKSDWDWHEFDPMSSKEEEQVLALSLCDTNQLYIDEESKQVRGFLTFNNLVSKIKRDRFLNKISFGLIKTKSFKSGYYQVNPPETSLQNAIRIIKMRINKHYSCDKINTQ